MSEPANPGDLVIDVDPDSEDESDASDEEADQEAQNLPQQAQALQAQLAPAVEAVVAEVQQFENALQIEAQQLPQGGVENPLEAHAPDRGSPEDQLVERLRQMVRQELAARRPPGPDTFLNNINYRYLVAAMGLIGGLMSSRAFYAALKSAFDPSVDATVALAETNVADSEPLPAGLVSPASGAAAVRAAWLMDEATYWGLLSGFVTRNGPRSYPEQLMFMQFTEDIAKLTMTSKWTWDKAADKLALINQVTDALKTQGAGGAYLLVPTLTYKGQSLPRAIAANITGLALAQWASEQTAVSV